MLKAIRKQVKFAEGITIDAYLIPPDEFRIGLVGASTSLGYAENWLYNVVKRGGRTLKALQEEGFDNLAIHEVQIQGVYTGRATASTISLNDYNVLIDYAISDGKKRAKALNRAFRQNDLDNRLRREFGVNQKPGWQQDLDVAQIIESMLDVKEELQMQFLPGDINVYGASACADIFYLN